jgi:FAD/FMN-containing dehydrogenase
LDGTKQRLNKPRRGLSEEEPMVKEAALKDLRAGLRGAVLTPTDAGYNEVCRIHNGMFVRRPALIARCLGTADVIDAVRFARMHDLELAVRGGGHSVAGKSVCEGGLMLDLSLMKGVHVDPRTRTVRAQAGVTWGEFNRQTQLLGFATTGECSPRPASQGSRSEAGSAGSWVSTGSPPTT